MSNIIYYNFKNRSVKNDYSATDNPKEQHISTWIGKNRRKYISIKFDAILNSRNEDEKNHIPKKIDDNIKLSQKIMDKIND